MNPEQPDSDSQEPKGHQETLRSWKEIAAYIQRNEATARRWEREEGLPVHRHPHKLRSSVYAYPTEIDAWTVAKKVSPKEEARATTGWWRPLAFGVTMTLCLVMVGNGVRPQTVSAQQQPASRQIWAESAGVEYSTISPDGRFIAFTRNQDGQLALHDLATGSDLQVTRAENGSGHPVRAVFSPDGTQIVFNWRADRADELRIASLNGGSPGMPRTLVKRQEEFPEIWPANWSPDGKSVAAMLFKKDRTAQLALISPVDGSFGRLNPIGGQAFGHRDVSHIFFSPDSRYLAYTPPADSNRGNRDVFLRTIDGDREIIAVTRGSDNQAAGWSPNGTQLLFISNRNGSPSLWAQRVEGGKPLGNPRLILPNFGANHLGYLGSSRTGDLYYSVLGGAPKFVIATWDAGSGNIIVNKELPAPGIQPDWSPDGQALAYRSESHLSIQYVETGQRRELFPRLVSFNWPRWSPDGRSLLVQGTDEKARQGVYRIDAQTSEVQAIALAPAGQGFGMPQWLPGGKRILYQRKSFSGDRRKAILERDLRSGRERVLVEGVDLADVDADVMLLALAVSPDGRFIAHIRMDRIAKKGSIELVALSGNVRRALVKLEGDKFVTLDGWTPDGKSLIYSLASGAGDAWGFETWIVPIDGGQPRRLDMTDRYARHVRVHPNGKQIAFWIPNQTPEQVWVVENVWSSTAGR